jgi:hypothetical protein
MMFLRDSIRRNVVYRRSKHVMPNGDHQPRTSAPAGTKPVTLSLRADSSHARARAESGGVRTPQRNLRTEPGKSASVWR